MTDTPTTIERSQGEAQDPAASIQSALPAVEAREVRRQPKPNFEKSSQESNVQSKSGRRQQMPFPNLSVLWMSADPLFGQIA